MTRPGHGAIQDHMRRFASIQVPAAIVLMALAVTNYLLDLGISSEVMLALVAGAGALGVPRPSEASSDE